MTSQVLMLIISACWLWIAFAKAVTDIRFLFLLFGLGGITELGLSNLDGNSDELKIESHGKLLVTHQCYSFLGKCFEIVLHHHQVFFSIWTLLLQLLWELPAKGVTSSSFIIEIIIKIHFCHLAHKCILKTELLFDLRIHILPSSDRYLIKIIYLLISILKLLQESLIKD